MREKRQPGARPLDWSERFANVCRGLSFLAPVVVPFLLPLVTAGS